MDLQQSVQMQNNDCNDTTCLQANAFCAQQENGSRLSLQEENFVKIIGGEKLNLYLELERCGCAAACQLLLLTACCCLPPEADTIMVEL